MQETYLQNFVASIKPECSLLLENVSLCFRGVGNSDAQPTLRVEHNQEQNVGAVLFSLDSDERSRLSRWATLIPFRELACASLNLKREKLSQDFSVFFLYLDSKTKPKPMNLEDYKKIYLNYCEYDFPMKTIQDAEKESLSSCVESRHNFPLLLQGRFLKKLTSP